jgi:hypothetical protein
MPVVQEFTFPASSHLFVLGFTSMTLFSADFMPWPGKALMQVAGFRKSIPFQCIVLTA